MYIYIYLALLYLLGIFIERRFVYKHRRKIWIFILILPLFILSALRAPTVGNDTYNYFVSYNIVAKESFFSVSQSRLEIGYIFYMRLIALFGFKYLGFQIITSFIILFSICRFIDRYSTNVSFSFFVFLTSHIYFGTMNITRQYLTIAILLFSIDAIKKQEFFKFCIYVAFASSIHFISIAFLIGYPLSKIRINKIRSIQLIIVGLVSSLFFNNIVRLFVKITGRYSSYLESGYFNFENYIAIYLNLCINICFFLLAYNTGYWKKDIRLINQKSTYRKLWYIFCLLTLIISIVGLNATIISRIEAYYKMFYIVYIPDVIRSINNKESRSIVSLGVIVGLFLSFIVIMIYRPYWTTVFPYEWFWDYVF